MEPSILSPSALSMTDDPCLRGGGRASKQSRTQLMAKAEVQPEGCTGEYK